ncbi:unnamed protein product [Leptidea sinapis]|uniref:Uncharacterized protein n=1 Tax=Leptidea sinapis TaxID=189913 RepID=A0A5E4QMM6_9NEOP|nr:unnamed protein product [Leptidea sinapis]
MENKSSISAEWHIPRPSLSSCSTGSVQESRSRGSSASSQGSSSNHSTHRIFGITSVECSTFGANERKEFSKGSRIES